MIFFFTYLFLSVKNSKIIIVKTFKLFRDEKKNKYRKLRTFALFIFKIKVHKYM